MRLLAAALLIASIVPAAAEPQKTVVGAWTTYVGDGEAGLERYGFAREAEKRDSILSIAQDAESVCPQTARVQFGFDDERPDDTAFQPQGEAGSRSVATVVVIAKGGVYQSPGRPATLDLWENDARLYVELDAKALEGASALAFCPTDPKGKPGADCHRFSLDGFARARRFVCTGK